MSSDENEFLQLISSYSESGRIDEVKRLAETLDTIPEEMTGLAILYLGQSLKVRKSVKQVKSAVWDEQNAKLITIYDDKDSKGFDSLGYESVKRPWNRAEENILKRKGERLLSGVIAFPGIVMGSVRNIGKDVPELIAQMIPGEIIVSEDPPGRIGTLLCHSTEVITMASAFITDTGIRTVGEAIIARTLGVPAVTRTREGTELLRTGKKIIADGAVGAIYAVKGGNDA